MALSDLTERQRALLAALAEEYRRDRTEFRAHGTMGGWRIVAWGTTGQRELSDWRNGFQESDLRDLADEGLIRLSLTGRSAYKGAVTTEGRRQMAQGTNDSGSESPQRQETAPLPEPLPDGFRLRDRYTIRRKIGSGGLATVYEAVDTTLDVVLALKVLSREHTEGKALERFLSEVRIACRINHPNVIRVFAYEDDPRPFYTMELIEGESLADRAGPLSAEEVSEVACGIAAALDRMHEQNIFHRDLKCANIMRDKSGRVVLLDLGLAKDSANELSLTEEGGWVGTRPYMSPEQFAGQASAASDIFSMGVVVSELLTGRLPFHGDDRDAPPDIDDVPERLREHVRRALCKDPGSRFSSAGSFAAALREPEHAQASPEGTEPHPGPQPAVNLQPALASLTWSPAETTATWDALRPEEREILSVLWRSEGRAAFLRDFGTLREDAERWNTATYRLEKAGLVAHAQAYAP